jgi:SET domain-containing protein|tara:strand:+ start:106 stop:561 length:456 start_codon:yes stop_codon:yes gene_type:complete
VKLYKIKKSIIDNRGLYAAQDIKVGTKIIFYKGKIITKKETENNEKYDNEKAIYLFNLNKKYDLDGDFKYNTARLINHSCGPNCEVTGKGLKLWIFAIRDIKKGEELSYDYGFGYDKDYKDYVCKCGKSNCCGFIVREGSRWRIKKSKSLR